MVHCDAFDRLRPVQRRIERRQLVHGPDQELVFLEEPPHALVELRAQALGANAVVGVDLDYEVLGQNNGMLMVSASGTAVVVE